MTLFSVSFYSALTIESMNVDLFPICTVFPFFSQILILNTGENAILNSRLLGIVLHCWRDRQLSIVKIKIYISMKPKRNSIFTFERIFFAFLAFVNWCFKWRNIADKIKFKYVGDSFQTLPRDSYISHDYIIFWWIDDG